MHKLKALTILIAILIGVGEIARWWGNPRFVPLAFDEIFIAAGMITAALCVRTFGPAPLAAAWGSFCGLNGSLLVVTLDHLFFGPPKESAVFYAITLAVIFVIGLAALAWSLALCRSERSAR